MSSKKKGLGFLTPAFSPASVIRRALLLAVIDIDCTLYSYCELFLSQKGTGFPFRGLSASSKEAGERFWRQGADRTFLKFLPHIEERARLAAALLFESGMEREKPRQAKGEGREKTAAAERPLLYTSYPLTEVKKNLLAPFPFRLHSSFPKKKTAEEAVRLCGKSADLVIGDRKEDRELARALGAVWRGFPFYDFHHLLSGAAYTKAFLSLLKDGAAAAKIAAEKQKETEGFQPV